jgi:hypothetical protein
MSGGADTVNVTVERLALATSAEVATPVLITGASKSVANPVLPPAAERIEIVQITTSLASTTVVAEVTPTHASVDAAVGTPMTEIAIAPSVKMIEVPSDVRPEAVNGVRFGGAVIVSLN